MPIESVLSLAGQFGPMGLFIAYLVWREQQTAKVAQRQEEARNEAQSAATEANKSLASSLGALTAVIQRLDR